MAVSNAVFGNVALRTPAKDPRDGVWHPTAENPGILTSEKNPMKFG